MTQVAVVGIGSTSPPTGDELWKFGKEKDMKGWKDLSQYEGQEIDFVSGLSQLTGIDEARYPDRTIFLKDYPDTVLIDMIFENHGKETHLKKMLPKATLYVGDVILKADRMLTGAMVR